MLELPGAGSSRQAEESEPLVDELLLPPDDDDGDDVLADEELDPELDDATAAFAFALPFPFGLPFPFALGFALATPAAKADDDDEAAPLAPT